MSARGKTVEDVLPDVVAEARGAGKLATSPGDQLQRRAEAAAEALLARAWPASAVPKAGKSWALVGFDAVSKANEQFRYTGGELESVQQACRELAAWCVAQPNRYAALRAFSFSPGEGGRKGQSARAIVCHGFDADLARVEYGHKPGRDDRLKGFATLEALRAFMADLAEQLPPSLVLETGGGVQFFYNLDRSAEGVEYEVEHQQGERLLAALQMLALKHGGALDSTVDAARVLRLPGCWRKKPAGRTGEVLVAARGRGYSAAELEAFCKAAEAKAAKLEAEDELLQAEARMLEPWRFEEPSSALGTRLPHRAAGSTPWTDEARKCEQARAQESVKTVRRIALCVSPSCRVLPAPGGVQVVELDICPACGGRESGGGVQRGSSRLTHAGRLVCFRESCRASGEGMSAEEWIRECAPAGRKQQLGRLRKELEATLHAARNAQAAEAGELQVDAQGRPEQTIQNLRAGLKKLGVQLWFDSFQQTFLMQTLEDDGQMLTRELNDAGMRSLVLTLEEELMLTRPRMDETLLAIAERDQRHAVRDYLAGLKWDGVPRLDGWLSTYLGAEASDYSREVGRCVLIAAVARVRNPGCKFDEMMILEGPQGVGKSRALAALVPKDAWFTDYVPVAGRGDTLGQRFMESVAGKWICELSELAGMNRAAVDDLKALLSRRTDRARMAYDRVALERGRQCILIGTTNAEEYLTDGTGNRRFWPVKVGTVNVDALERVRDQLWAEAARRQAAGESFLLKAEAASRAVEEQELRRVDDPMVDKLQACLGEMRDACLSTADAWQIVGIDPGKASQKDRQRLGAAMRQLGWMPHQQRVDGGQRRWFYFIGSGARRVTVAGLPGGVDVLLDGQRVRSG